MTVSITRCWKRRVRRLAFAAGLALAAGLVHAGSIEPLRAAIASGDEGYALSADFAVNLGSQLEEALARGLPLYFNLEITISHPRWYWSDEHVAGRVLHYRLSYSALTRQYRLSIGSLHLGYDSLADALRVLSRVVSLPVADKGVLRPGEAYQAAVRLSLDRTQLPKPFQVDAIANPDWEVDAKVLRWQFTPAASTAEAK
jgi:hypothetical protein